MPFAVIETGGKQYIIEPGMKLRVEKLDKPSKGDTFTFDNVLLAESQSALKIGAPFIKGAKVTAKLVGEGRRKKITILRYQLVNHNILLLRE